MAVIQIHNIPLAVQRLNEIYQFESASVINRFLFSKIIAYLGDSLVDERGDDKDIDLDFIEGLIPDLPAMRALPGEGVERSSEKLLNDLAIAAVSIAVIFLETNFPNELTKEIVRDILFSGDGSEEEKARMNDLAARQAVTSIRYYDVGTNGYAICWCNDEDLSFENFLNGLQTDINKLAAPDYVYTFNKKD